MLVRYTHKVSAEEAATSIKSGDNVFIHSAAAFPQKLVDAMVTQRQHLRNVKVCHIFVLGRPTYIDFPDSFRVNNFYVGNNMRSAVNEGLADYVPVFLSEVCWRRRYRG